MTENEWLASTDPKPMLDWLRTSGKASDRKLRLFAVACCRHFLPLIDDERYGQAIEASETFVDWGGSEAGMKRARQAVRTVRHRLPASRGPATPEWAPLWLAEVTASENAVHGVSPEIQRLASLGLIPN